MTEHVHLPEDDESLRPTRIGPGSATPLRRYQHLVMRYVDGASMEQICAALAVSGRQARRDHREAIDALSENLWQRYVQSRAAAAASDESPVDVAPMPAYAGLDAELDFLAPDLVGDLAELADVVSSAVGTVARLAEAAGVACRVEVPAALTCPVNRSATRQALVHLLALTFDVEAVAGVRLSAREERQTTRVIIAADLPPRQLRGKAPADVEGWTGRDERFRVARRLIEMVGGTVEQCPEPNGFAISIAFPSPRPTRVLAIDNPDMLRLMQRHLVGSTYWLLPATTAEKALELATTADPDVYPARRPDAVPRRLGAPRAHPSAAGKQAGAGDRLLGPPRAGAGAVAGRDRLPDEAHHAARPPGRSGPLCAGARRASRLALRHRMASPTDRPAARETSTFSTTVVSSSNPLAGPG